jgi:hypothetical protein
MSKITLVSPISGTAEFSITTPSGTSTDRTLTLPDNSGTVITTGSTFAGTGPAFSAWQSTQQTALSANTATKLLFQTEEFDTNSNYDTSTSRFTPTVAGYYQVNAAWTAAASYAYGQIQVHKNGASYKFGNATGIGGTSNIWTLSVLVYLNGSTDYVEIYGETSVSQPPSASATLTYFQASMVRAA